MFGRPFDVRRYKMALEAAALIADIRELSGNKGDETQIGEKGLNLSGGQKAGVSLARAVYANADLYLIDDVLAAVDVGVAQTMMEGCILGVLRSKTRVVVSHRAGRWLRRMDQIVMMEGGSGSGTIVDAGTFDELKARGRYDSTDPHELPPEGSEEEEAATLQGGMPGIESDEALVAHASNSTTAEDADPEAQMVRTVSESAGAPRPMLRTRILRTIITLTLPPGAPGPMTLSRTLSDFGPSAMYLQGSAKAPQLSSSLPSSDTSGDLTKDEDRETGAVKASDPIRVAPNSVLLYRIQCFKCNPTLC